MAQKSATKKSAGSDNKALTKKELKTFQALLSEKREALLSSAHDSRKTLFEASEKHPDEVDLATAEYEQSFEYRMRDREKYLVKKIDKALHRIEVGEYDECESCGEIISKKRLMARPEATLCIVCKEEQEQIEKGFLKRRELNNQQYNN